MCTQIQRRGRFLLIFQRIVTMCLCGVFCLVGIEQTPFVASSVSLVPGIGNGAGFVTRADTQLLLGGQPFRFSGTNVYWLGLEEQENSTIVYPSHFQVDDALATASFMGATVVRAHTLGISVGCSLCLEPALGQFNDAAFQSIDYALQSIQLHHLKVIIPFVDNWHYYHGGKHTFTDWRGLSNERAFYTNTLVIHDFEHYIQIIMNHVNQYTGIAYKDDPTILAWETGNELSAPVRWVSTISAFMKSIDTKHLLMDGNYEQADATSNFSSDVAIKTLDLYTGHYYPPRIDALQTELTQANNAQKVFIVGEYDWNTQQGDTLQTFLSAIEGSRVAGDLYWSLFPHNDSHGFVDHNEHFTLRYPGKTPALQQQIDQLVVHAYIMQGRAIPSNPPGVPLITRVHNALITWRGAFGAETYSIERATQEPEGSWVEVCHRCVTDYTSPWKDGTQPSGSVIYRIRGYSIEGVAGPYSPIFPVTSPSDNGPTMQ